MAAASKLVISCQELPSCHENIIIFSVPRWRKGWRHCSKLFTFIPPPSFLSPSLPSPPRPSFSREKQGIDLATYGVICTACTWPGKKVVWLSSLPKNVPWTHSLGVCLGGDKTGNERAHFPAFWAIPLANPTHLPPSL